MSKEREVARVKHRGIMYSRSSTHTGNSLVLFHPKGNNNLPPIPASIESIRQTGSIYELFVRRQKPALGTPDPFQKYAHFPARLYSVELDYNVERIDLEWVSAHYARYPWDDRFVAVVSLSKVLSVL